MKKLILFMFLCTALFAQHQTSNPTALHAEMHAYESQNTLAITVSGAYYGIEGEMTVGHTLGNWTVVTGSEDGTSASITDSGDSIKVGGEAHGLTSGDCIELQSANHKGTGIVDVVNANDFLILLSYVGEESCTWQEGDYLLAGNGTAGTYVVTYDMSFKAGAAAKQFKIEGRKNATHIDNAAFEITTAGNDHDSGSATTIETIAAGDRIWMVIKNETDTQNIEYEHSGITLHKL